MVSVIFSHCSWFSDTFQFYKRQRDEILLLQLGLARSVGVIVTRQHFWVIHHEPGRHVYFPSNNCQNIGTKITDSAQHRYGK